VSAPALRIGVLRPSTASPDPVVALAEARVVRHELSRRLGEVNIDFRNDGGIIDPWLPAEHGAWPGDVDATIELSPVTGAEGPHLLAVFARTVDPTAADVRRRMLAHLGVLPIDHLDDDELHRRLPAPRRPTDVWLLARAAEVIDLSDRQLGSLRGDDEEAAAIDAWFDQCVAGLSIDTSPTVARLSARVDELETALTDAQSDAARSERLALDRLEELQSRYDVLRERLTRTELDRTELERVELDRSLDEANRS
jgi:hypothetical protein